MIRHGLDFDGAQTRRIGNCGARHAREDHRADDVDVAEAAFQPTDQRKGEVVDPIGDAG